MSNFIKLTHVKGNRAVCVRKSDIAMINEDVYTGWYEGEMYRKPCTLIVLSEDRKDCICVKESADKIMEMMKDE